MRSVRPTASAVNHTHVALAAGGDHAERLSFAASAGTCGKLLRMWDQGWASTCA